MLGNAHYSEAMIAAQPQSRSTVVQTRNHEGQEMADDKNNVGGQDRARINMNEDYEVQDWTKSLGVTREQLQEAVDAVGDQAEAVRNYLKT
jgi:hypothetical protein